MKSIICFLVTVIGLASCAPFYLANLQSDNLKYNDKKYFFENDTILISYNFRNFNDTPTLSIINKLSVPVFFDKGQSKIVVNDKMFSFKQTINSIGKLSTDFDNNNYDLSIKSNVPVRQEIILPKSKLTIKLSFDYLLAKVRFRENEKTYTRDSTAFKIRNFIAISLVENSFDKLVYYDHEFYVNKIVKKDKQQILNNKLTNTYFYQ